MNSYTNAYTYTSHDHSKFSSVEYTSGNLIHLTHGDSYSQGTLAVGSFTSSVPLYCSKFYDVVSSIHSTTLGSNRNNLILCKPNVSSIIPRHRSAHELRILYQNVRGLNSKIFDFFLATSSCSADIILISESWLQSNVFRSELFPSHYKTFRRDRDLSLGKSGGGGLLVAFSDWIKIVRLQDYEVSSILCETLLLKISYSLSIFYLCLVYLPPPVSINSLKNLFQSLEKCPNINNENLILIGDLNISQCSDTSFNFSSGNSVTRSIYPLLSLYNLKSYNNVKNHFGKTLDLVLRNFLFPPNISVTRTNPLSIEDKYHPPLQIKSISSKPKLLALQLHLT